MPCLLCEWTYTAIDRDNSQLGIMVIMVDPGFKGVPQSAADHDRIRAQVVEPIQDVQMEPALKVNHLA